MPKAIIRVYLVDGRFKTMVVDSNMETKDCIGLCTEKFSLTSRESYADYKLFETYDNVVNELNPQTRPFEISQRWGAKSGDTHRFLFKRPTDKVQTFETAFSTTNNPVAIPEKKKEKKSKKSKAEKQEVQRASAPSTSTQSIPSLNQQPSSTSQSSPDLSPQLGKASSPPVRPIQNNGGDYSMSGQSTQPTQLSPTAPRKPYLPPGAQPLFFASASLAPAVRPTRPPGGSQENGPDTSQGEYIQPRPMRRPPGPAMPGMGPIPTKMASSDELSERLGKMKQAESEKKQKEDLHIKSITAWSNYHLAQRKFVINNLLTDFKDGVMLANLIEILSGKEVPFNPNPKTVTQCVENLSNSLTVLQSLGVNPRGCSAEDINKGIANSVIGFMLLVIKRFSNVSKDANGRFSVILTSQGNILTGGTPSGETVRNQGTSPTIERRNVPAKTATGMTMKSPEMTMKSPEIVREQLTKSSPAPINRVAHSSSTPVRAITVEARTTILRHGDGNRGKQTTSPAPNFDSKQPIEVKPMESKPVETKIPETKIIAESKPFVPPSVGRPQLQKNDIKEGNPSSPPQTNSPPIQIQQQQQAPVKQTPPQGFDPLMNPNRPQPNTAMRPGPSAQQGRGIQPPGRGPPNRVSPPEVAPLRAPNNMMERSVNPVPARAPIGDSQNMQQEMGRGQQQQQQPQPFTMRKLPPGAQPIFMAPPIKQVKSVQTPPTQQNVPQNVPPMTQSNQQPNPVQVQAQPIQRPPGPAMVPQQVTKPVQQQQPVQQIPQKTAQPVQKPVQQIVQPVQPVQQIVQPVQPVQQPTGIQSVKQTVQPNQKTVQQPIQRIQLAQSQPNHPIQPIIQPIQPIQQPTQRVQSIHPIVPIQPIKPVQPITQIKPDSYQPLQKQEPVERSESTEFTYAELEKMMFDLNEPAPRGIQQMDDFDSIFSGVEQGVEELNIKITPQIQEQERTGERRPTETFWKVKPSRAVDPQGEYEKNLRKGEDNNGDISTSRQEQNFIPKDKKDDMIGYQEEDNQMNEYQEEEGGEYFDESQENYPEEIYEEEGENMYDNYDQESSPRSQSPKEEPIEPIEPILQVPEPKIEEKPRFSVQHVDVEQFVEEDEPAEKTFEERQDLENELDELLDDLGGGVNQQTTYMEEIQDEEQGFEEEYEEVYEEKEEFYDNPQEIYTPANTDVSVEVVVGSSPNQVSTFEETTVDEPLFDQFDELEDFLADLAGELGVYENM